MSQSHVLSEQNIKNGSMLIKTKFCALFKQQSTFLIKIKDIDNYKYCLIGTYASFEERGAVSLALQQSFKVC